MKVDQSMWDLMQKHLGYTDEEMRLFKENPRNEKALSRTVELMNKTIVVEVVESHGCNSHHKKGDKFYLDGAGNLISKLCPKRMCIFAMHPLSASVFGVHELFYAGLDPNEMLFKRVGCNDVGVNCGGWGHIVMEVRIEDRKK